MTKPNAGSDSMIRARDIHLTLGAQGAATRILKNVDIDIGAGEILAILGPSGSGKSSLMAVLSGLERATSGSLSVGGIDYSELNEDDLARARRGKVGIVLQSFHLLPTMTALENVAVPLELAGHPKPFDKARDELDAVGLGHRLTHYPAQLSGGEQQRVAIARAMAPRPGIIFADEPTGNLDQATSEGIVDLLFERQAAASATLIIITHDQSLADRCQRVVQMSDGRIVSDMPA